MRYGLIIFLLVNCYFGLCSGQDSTKKYRFILSTYPSNLFVGDASIGFEQCYKKRWSQEAQIFIKCFGPNYSNYKYDQGSRFNYFLKYNFINRKRIRISGNISYAYKHLYFKNKQDALFVNFSNASDDPNPPPLFSMDRSVKAYGPGIGITFNYNINKHFSIGSDLQLEYLNRQLFFNVNDPEKFYEYYPEYLYFPADGLPVMSYRSPFHYRLSPFYTIKLSYCL